MVSGRDEFAGSVIAYAIDLATSALTKIGTTPTSSFQPGGIAATRQCVFVTNIQGGYDAFAIDRATGTLRSVPALPLGGYQLSSTVATPDGNFVYFNAARLPGFGPPPPPPQIVGFFVDPASCALTPVPGSPFNGPGGSLRLHPYLPVL